jgi:UDP-glucose:(heptosyl)LPS alpha-1,3-glucosyltransferase
MKIAFVRARYSHFGGAERFLNSSTESAAAQGASPTIITRAWPSGADATIQHRVVNPGYLTSAGRDRGFARAVCALLARDRFDLVQSYERLSCCDVFHAVDGVHAEWLEQRQRVQSATRRFGTYLNPHHRYVLQAEREMYASPRLRAVICISYMVKRDVIRHYGVAEERLHVIYGGIDSATFHPGLRDQHRAALRLQHHIPAGAPVALFVGSGFERKGVAAFLATLRKVEGLFGIVVGHDKHLARQRAAAQQMGLSGRVLFTGGITDVRPYYAASDLFFMPTLYEPFGLVFGEAMACGLPVITSPQAGAADWIRHGINGFVVDPLDVPAMANAITAALGAPGMGALARQTVLPFSQASAAARYAELYRQLLR